MSFPVVFYRCVKLNKDLLRVKSLRLTTNEKTIITTNIYGTIACAESFVSCNNRCQPNPSVWVWTCLLVALVASSHLLGRCQSIWGKKEVTTLEQPLARSWASHSCALSNHHLTEGKLKVIESDTWHSQIFFLFIVVDLLKCQGFLRNTHYVCTLPASSGGLGHYWALTFSCY